MSNSFVTPWAVARQAPLSMRFPRQEYWSGLLFCSSGNPPDPRIEPGVLHCRQILYRLSRQGSPCGSLSHLFIHRDQVSNLCLINAVICSACSASSGMKQAHNLIVILSLNLNVGGRCYIFKLHH